MAAITAAAIGAASTVYAANQAKKAQKEQNKFVTESQKGADPYAQYRGDAAARLDKLSKDPSSIKDSAVWKSRMQAAERAVASQGYTGSGNALVAAADAGASAYQSEFDNLARLSGADVGIQTAGGVSSAGMGARQDGSDNYLSSIGGVANNLGNLATVAGGRFNQPASNISVGAGANASWSPGVATGGGTAFGTGTY